MGRSGSAAAARFEKSLLVSSPHPVEHSGSSSSKCTPLGEGGCLHQHHRRGVLADTGGKRR
eukprot:186786-Alexandrium_andersonii.AAC.1